MKCVMMKLSDLALILLLGISNTAIAASFSADAVRIRDGQFSHARMFWLDGNVRFEYLEDGVPMVQIIDNKNSKMIWLDTENKLYVRRELDDHQAQPAQAVDEKLDKGNPCRIFVGAECTRLKETVINERDAVKWLITLDDHGEDMHVFQWLDKKLGIPLKQLNPDGSTMDISIQEGLEMNGRKVRKQEVFAVGSDGMRDHSIQWLDTEFGVVVRQQDDNGGTDELRDIKLEKVGKEMFVIPKDYKQFDAPVKVVQPEKSGDMNPTVK